jgi:hypothetical protein
MQFRKNTSMSKRNNILVLLVKVSLILSVIIAIVVLLNKIDFPSPNKEIKKSIPNENLKIVK